ncbi:MAG: hypothetical protein FWE13_06305 [Firmicutes bacterium]|nr:hypothetical protein [Bacillota bacterium]
MNNIISLLNNQIIGLEPLVFYLILALTIVMLIAIIVIIILAVRAKKRSQRGIQAPKVKVHKKVRYSADEKEIEANGEVNVTHHRGDFNIKRGEIYTANRKGELLPGKYTVLSTSESENKFNIRIGRYAREYSHGDTIVIPDGETIASPSHSLVLR